METLFGIFSPPPSYFNLCTHIFLFLTFFRAEGWLRCLSCTLHPEMGFDRKNQTVALSCPTTMFPGVFDMSVPATEDEAVGFFFFPIFPFFRYLHVVLCTAVL